MNFKNIFSDSDSPWPPDSKTGLTFSNGAILSPAVAKTKSVKESKISEGKYYFPSLILEALCTKESEIVEENGLLDIWNPDIWKHTQLENGQLA